MGRGRNNKDAADKGRTPSSSSSPVVLGPFEDLLDSQTKADLTGGQDGDGVDVVADTAANEEEEEAAEGEADADADAQEDEEASSDQAPDDDGDGYLSDDSDEHLEPASLGSIIALKRFSLTLLVPFNRKPEVKRTAVTVAALLDDWKDQLSPDVLQTTTYQELTATYFPGTRYGRLQVTFNHVRDANFVWSQVIRHECANGDIVDFTWQHPKDARFLRERLLNPTAKEVVVKGVTADITAELIRHLLVVSKLVKRGRSAFASGFGFHRTVDPVSGLDTDRIRGLFIPHADDEYRWRYFVEDPSTGRPSLARILKDPAVILTSTGGVQEEWVCVQTVCEKAQGNRFEQAAAHVASARHKGGLKKQGAATRASKHSQKMAAFKREFMATSAKNIGLTGELSGPGPGETDDESACKLRAHVAEERKRVKATMAHLELKVEELRRKVMSDPSSQALYEDLIKNEAALKLYQDNNKERLQVLTGLLQELAGETPSGFLSGLVKSRKAKTEIAELTFNGVLRKGASEVLQVASEHFREAYALSPLSSPVEPWPIEEGKTLQESDRLQLDSKWSEQEVKAALKGLPTVKAPGQDALPK
ncbi:unnamed protein product [Closterium sp. NIES-64]|nr:unnamed protein product [Closterium sp. NIES-64]